MKRLARLVEFDRLWSALPLPTVGSNYERHSKLQRFMLANDSVTVAVEVPIWLGEADIAALETQYGIELVPKDGNPRSITGHIDFLQVRNGAVYVLDYKPDARTNKPIAQLTIYALALTRLVPGLRLFDIKCAWFNENGYCEFSPALLSPAHSPVPHAPEPSGPEPSELDTIRPGHGANIPRAGGSAWNEPVPRGTYPRSVGVVMQSGIA